MQNRIIKFIKAERLSENSVEVTYQMSQTKTEFKVEWNNIHPQTGEVGAYDLQHQFDCDDPDTLERLTIAYQDGESGAEADLYVEMRDTFDASDCESCFFELCDDRISFTRHMNAPIFFSERWRDPTVMTWFKCSEAAKNAYMKSVVTPLWVVRFQDEYIVVTASQAKKLGYTNNDESFKAMENNDGGFNWIPAQAISA